MATTVSYSPYRRVKIFVISILTHIVPLFVSVNTEANKYCSLCFTPGTHTMCIYPDKGPGKNCKGYSEKIFDEKVKNLILHYHNVYRNKVALGYAENEYGPQHPATGMLQLIWHDELQEIAQRWADQCTPFEDSAQHDVCKATEEFDVGQNIITIGSPSIKPMNYSEAIKDWYREVVDYDRDWVSSYKGSIKPPKKIGHYTQLVWARSQYVGCASVTFTDIVRKKKFSVNRLVCNYGPSGNIIDASVYKVGEPCSKCPSGTTCNSQWGGLCATNEQLSTSPIMPVENTVPPTWVIRKYRKPQKNFEDFLPTESETGTILPLVTLSKRKRPSLTLNSTTTLTREVLKSTSLSASPKTLPSSIASKFITFTATTTTSKTTSSDTSTRSQTTSSTTKQPVVSPTMPSFKSPTTSRDTSQTTPMTKSQPAPTPRLKTDKTLELQVVNMDNASLSSDSWTWRRQQTQGLSRSRKTYLWHRRQRWRSPICLCPVEEGEEVEEEENEFSKRQPDRKALRSARASCVPNVTLVLTALVLFCAH